MILKKWEKALDSWFWSTLQAKLWLQKQIFHSSTQMKNEWSIFDHSNEQCSNSNWQWHHNACLKLVLNTNSNDSQSNNATSSAAFWAPTSWCLNVKRSALQLFIMRHDLHHNHCAFLFLEYRMLSTSTCLYHDLHHSQLYQICCANRLLTGLDSVVCTNQKPLSSSYINQWVVVVWSKKRQLARVSCVKPNHSFVFHCLTILCLQLNNINPNEYHIILKKKVVDTRRSMSKIGARKNVEWQSVWQRSVRQSSRAQQYCIHFLLWLHNRWAARFKRAERNNKTV